MKIALLVLIAAMVLSSCSRFSGTLSSAPENNPLLQTWNTPYQVPPFDEIKEDHFIPAMRVGMAEHKKEIEQIANNSAAPDFANTIEALDAAGQTLKRVRNVFGNLTSANTNDKLQDIAKKIAPELSKHGDDILLNEKLFARIKTVFEGQKGLDLNQEQKMLLEKTYKDFVRGGANLSAKDKVRLREINKELSLLSLQFSENILKENNRFELVIDKESDLAGLPEAVKAEAASTARKRDHAGKWVFTLHKPSLIPFLQYSEKRELREKMFKGYIERGHHNDELDNKAILSKMAMLRVEKANLLGYPTHADYILDVNMAKTPAHVYKLLNQLWTPALKRAKDELAQMQAIADHEGAGFKLKAWDWWYYAEKLRKNKYDLDENMLRPYFKMENVRAGIFDLAGKLWGLKFEPIDIPKYHEEVDAFAVKEADGTLLGIFYTDYFPRAGKRGGAWMNSYRKEVYRDGKRVIPIICNVGNFSRPVGDKPALLSFEEVSTMFHEFGHALHGLLSDCHYDRLSGTSVSRDYVEMPSQIMENWASEPEVLRHYAHHYLTGEVIPDELLEKLKQAKYFNQGFATVEYLAASFLDMDWHTITAPVELEPVAFEAKSMAHIGLISEIVPRYCSWYFSHIFSGGYSAGYYSYIWAAVLDADGFEAFKENGIYDHETAQRYRKFILSAGGSDDPMVLYKKFRGAEPKIEPLLIRRGLK